ncbi:hypothetical protein AB4516_20220 [Vibrio sp. 10N.222.54.F12]|uniref:hypothetical protein n=1 Tax=Vibrio TaxID=662 RepID=UPI000C834F33|nr:MULTISPECIES: hypothetical protein [Vibrio]PMG84209.1 hypothetical protein BCU82_19660 [Vibrio cyclitrophicus]PML11193.1 hypothetical protein BCT83_22025 [Vibrio tasmaniensis]PML45884.1 hypothetical protein BCT76_16245 [Vibrio tasmaniensis]
MDLRQKLLGKTELNAVEISSVLLELGYANRFNHPCAKTLSQMTNVSYRHASRMIKEHGVAGVYYSNLLFQLGIKQPEYLVH